MPPATRDRWDPGLLVTGNRDTWARPVPEQLRWMITSGGPGRRHLDAAAAATLLHNLTPPAQALLDGLFDTGDLDWSAASASAALTIAQGCSPGRPENDPAARLVDYADVIQRFPQVYQPDHLRLFPDPLAERCRWITQYLGLGEHDHPEVMEAFGAPRPGGGQDPACPRCPRLVPQRGLGHRRPRRYHR